MRAELLEFPITPKIRRKLAEAERQRYREWVRECRAGYMRPPEMYNEDEVS